MKLRPYQQKGRSDILKTWETHPIVMFVLATGGGKTVTFVEIMKEFLFAGKRAVLMAHREELIYQGWETLKKNNIYAGIVKSGEPERFDLPAQVGSIQTMIRRRNLPLADVLIIDEGHHVADGNSYGQIIAKYMEANPALKVLIVTATPYRLSGEGFENIVKGHTTQLVVNSTLKSLTDNGWLVPIRYFATYVPDMDDVRMRGGDYEESESQEKMELAPIIESYTEHAKGLSGVCFAINVPHSISIVQKYLYAGVPAEHLDANTRPDERLRILSDFRCGLVKVISNVGIITEGFDFPDLQFIQLARPTKSLSLFCQMVGRVTRPEAGLVDAFSTTDGRVMAIAQSGKPHGIVLDNAGCFKDHYYPDYPHDWERYFRGWKRKKGDSGPIDLGTMEMLVFEVEDAQGNRRKVYSAKEVEGLKLIEVTKEQKRKIVNLKIAKEFDALYAKFKRLPKVNRPGYIAFDRFIDQCNKKDMLIVPEIWDLIEHRLVRDPKKKMEDVERSHNENPGFIDADMLKDAKARIMAQSISFRYFTERKTEYIRINADQLAEYLAAKVIHK